MPASKIKAVKITWGLAPVYIDRDYFKVLNEVIVEVCEEIMSEVSRTRPAIWGPTVYMLTESLHCSPGAAGLETIFRIGGRKGLQPIVEERGRKLTKPADIVLKLVHHRDAGPWGLDRDTGFFYGDK